MCCCNVTIRASQIPLFQRPQSNAIINSNEVTVNVALHCTGHSIRYISVRAGGVGGGLHTKVFLPSSTTLHDNSFYLQFWTTLKRFVGIKSLC